MTRRLYLPPILCLLVAWIFLSVHALAHDLPADVTVQAFFKPSGDHAQLVVRLPLKAMRDIEFPERDGYLDIARADPLLKDASIIWIAHLVGVFENDTPVAEPHIQAVRLALESDRSFSSYDAAIAHLSGPKLADDMKVAWDQVFLDVALDYRIASDQSRFSIKPQWARLGLRVTTVLRYLPADGGVRALEYIGDPGLIRLDPHWYQAALQFVRLGFQHIMGGIDHLLFLLCLVVPFRRLRPLVLIVTAFTVAHSITLIASAQGFVPHALWFPPLVETLIAASIVYMALENIIGNSNLHRRWIAAFCFGLVHGFGFSFALAESLQFAGTHLLTSLLSFNVGVELGQLLVVVVLIPVLDLTFRYVAPERIGTIILSVLVAHTAWHWMIDRAGVLSRYEFTWPDLVPAGGLFAMLTAITLLVMLVWALTLGLTAYRRRIARPR